MSTSLTADGIRQFPFFSDLDEADAAAATRILTLRTVAAGEPVFKQGDVADCVYLLAVGEVEIRFGDGGDGRTIQVRAPSIVGEMGVLLSRPRTATVAARADTELWHLCRHELDAALDRGERWAAHFAIATARSLAERLSDVQDEIQPMVAALRAGTALGRSSAPDDLERLRDRLFTEWTF